MKMKIDREWLLRMAEKEGSGITSVGGLLVRLGLPVKPRGEGDVAPESDKPTDIAERWEC